MRNATAGHRTRPVDCRRFGMGRTGQAASMVHCPGKRGQPQRWSVDEWNNLAPRLVGDGKSGSICLRAQGGRKKRRGGGGNRKFWESVFLVGSFVQVDGGVEVSGFDESLRTGRTFTTPRTLRRSGKVWQIPVEGGRKKARARVSLFKAKQRGQLGLRARILFLSRLQ